jgi:hypothetical protein
VLKGISSTPVICPRNKRSFQNCNSLQLLPHIAKHFMLQSSKAVSNVATSKHVDASFDATEAKRIAEMCGVLAFKTASHDKGDHAHSIYINFSFVKDLMPK